MHSVIDEVYRMFKIAADIQETKLIYNITSSFPQYVKGDKTRLQQVLVNLINNALKFTANTGFIKIYASYLREEEKILIKVQDTGKGISKEDQKLIFKKFGKLQDVHKLNNKGVGLGLIICKELC